MEKKGVSVPPNARAARMTPPIRPISKMCFIGCMKF
jgi:hypothetical protein